MKRRRSADKFEQNPIDELFDYILMHKNTNGKEDFVYTLACLAQKKGFSLEEVLDFSVRRFVQPDFSEKEVRALVESAFQKQT